MKKFGFTLAEVLITLGLIGVVASMTVPNVVINTRTAQIGPKLAAAVATFEQANQALLNAQEVDSLPEMFSTSRITTNDYANRLLSHLKGEIVRQNSSIRIRTRSGYDYDLGTDLDFFRDETTNPENNNSIHERRIFIREPNDRNAIRIIINRPRNEVVGVDSFDFSLWYDGSLKPKGSIGWNGRVDSNERGKENWRAHCPDRDALENRVRDASYCAGSIFENNLRVRYRL